MDASTPRSRSSRIRPGRLAVIVVERPAGVAAAASDEAQGLRGPFGHALGASPAAVPAGRVRLGDHDRYGDYSRRIHEIFGFYTPLVQGLALDEAFLDVTGGRRLFGSSVEIGTAIRRRIAEEVAWLHRSASPLPCSWPSSPPRRPSRPPASPASSPVPAWSWWHQATNWPSSIRSRSPSCGAWAATAARLDRLGVATIGDLARVPRRSLEAAVGSAAGRHLHDLAWVATNGRCKPNRDVKSVGHEETYAHDRYEHADLRREVVRMSDAVATRYVAGLAGRTVTLKVRFGDFATITVPSVDRSAQQRPDHRRGRPGAPGRRRGGGRCAPPRRRRLRVFPRCRPPTVLDLDTGHRHRMGQGRGRGPVGRGHRRRRPGPPTVRAGRRRSGRPPGAGGSIVEADRDQQWAGCVGMYRAVHQQGPSDVSDVANPGIVVR